MARLESLLQRISQCHIVGLDLFFLDIWGPYSFLAYQHLIRSTVPMNQAHSCFSTFQLSRPRLSLLHLLINFLFYLSRLL